jgi:hypothetical protein
VLNQIQYITTLNMHHNLLETDAALDLELLILLGIPFIISHNEPTIHIVCLMSTERKDIPPKIFKKPGFDMLKNLHGFF